MPHGGVERGDAARLEARSVHGDRAQRVEGGVAAFDVGAPHVDIAQRRVDRDVTACRNTGAPVGGGLDGEPVARRGGQGVARRDGGGSFAVVEPVLPAPIAVGVARTRSEVEGPERRLDRLKRNAFGVGPNSIPPIDQWGGPRSSGRGDGASYFGFRLPPLRRR